MTGPRMVEKKAKDITSYTTPVFKTVEEYFRAEEKSVRKHEYHNGIIIPTAGANAIHNLLASTFMIMVGIIIKQSKLPVRVSNSDTKIWIEAFNKIIYPDALVIGNKFEYFAERKDTIVNPMLVVEVGTGRDLSLRSQRHDRTTKFEMYRTIPAFQEYVLIYQDELRLTVWTKQTNGDWRPADYVGEAAIAILYSLDQCPLPLAELYDGVW